MLASDDLVELEAAGVKLRDAVPGDLPFLVDSWRSSATDKALGSLGIPEGALDVDVEQRVLEQLVAVHDKRVRQALAVSQVAVAVEAEHPTRIIGYAVAELRPRGRREPGGPVVHWVYVKHPFRRMGVARALLDLMGAHGARYTHHTRAGARLAERLGARYSPEAFPE